jgi:hypothetical protein
MPRHSSAGLQPAKPSMRAGAVRISLSTSTVEILRARTSCLLHRIAIGLPCFEPAECAYACAGVHDVEYSIEVFVCGRFENVDTVCIGLAHAAEMMAEVTFGEELRKDGLIERGGWRSTRVRADANASTGRPGRTMKPRRSALKSIFVKVPT